MRLPWQSCEHEKIRIKRYDQGVDKRIELFCDGGCKKKIGEQVGKTLFLREDDSDEPK